MHCCREDTQTRRAAQRFMTEALMGGCSPVQWLQSTGLGSVCAHAHVHTHTRLPSTTHILYTRTFRPTLHSSIYTHTQSHTCTYINMHSLIHPPRYTRKHPQASTHAHTDVYVHTHTHVHYTYTLIHTSTAQAHTHGGGAVKLGVPGRPRQSYVGAVACAVGRLCGVGGRDGAAVGGSSWIIAAAVVVVAHCPAPLRLPACPPACLALPT